MARAREEVAILRLFDDPNLDAPKGSYDIVFAGLESKEAANAVLKTGVEPGGTYRIIRLVGPPIRVEVETVEKRRIVPAEEEATDE